MSYTLNENVPCLVIDSIKHPVVSNAKTVALFSLEFSDSRRARIGLQIEDLFADTLLDIIGQTVHFPLRRPLDFNGIAHLCLPLAIFQVISEGAGWFLFSLLNSGEIHQVTTEISVLHKAEDYKLSLPLWKGSDSGENTLSQFFWFSQGKTPPLGKVIALETSLTRHAVIDCRETVPVRYLAMGFSLCELTNVFYRDC